MEAIIFFHLRSCYIARKDINRYKMAANSDFKAGGCMWFPRFAGSCVDVEVVCKGRECPGGAGPLKSGAGETQV